MVAGTAVLVLAAGVAAAVVVLPVVVAALGVGVKGQLTRQQVGYLFVRITGGAGIELDAGVCQSGAGAAANAAADENIYALLAQKSSQSAVAAAYCADYLGGEHLAVLNLIELKLFAVAEVLEHLAIFIGYRDFHHITPLSILYRDFRKKQGTDKFHAPEGWFCGIMGSATKEWPDWPVGSQGKETP